MHFFSFSSRPELIYRVETVLDARHPYSASRSKSEAARVAARVMVGRRLQECPGQAARIGFGQLRVVLDKDGRLAGVFHVNICPPIGPALGGLGLEAAGTATFPDTSQNWGRLSACGLLTLPANVA